MRGRRFAEYIGSIGLSIALFFGPFVAYGAWLNPTCNPDSAGGPTDPSCNVSAPLNISSATQKKAGILEIQNTLKAASLTVDSAVGSGNGSVTITTNTSATNAFAITHAGNGPALKSTVKTSGNNAGEFCNNANNCVYLGHSSYGALIYGPTYISKSVSNNLLLDVTNTNTSATPGFGARFVTMSGVTPLQAPPQGTAVQGQANTGYGIYGFGQAGSGVYGTSPASYGVQGVSTNERGVYGSSTSKSGVYGTSTNSYGVEGFSANERGVYGSSTNRVGVYGTSNNSYGVEGYSPTQNGVRGTSDSNSGVYGSSTSNVGVYGLATSNSGVYGESSTGSGVQAKGLNNSGVYSEGRIGVRAISTGVGAGVDATSTDGYGVSATSTNKQGVYGYSQNTNGIQGETGSATSSGVRGYSTTAATGVTGESASGYGVYGTSNSQRGVYGNSGTNVGVYGNSTSGSGVQGVSASNTGVFGSSGGNAGVSGTTSANNQSGVYGQSTAGGAGYGVYGSAANGVGVYGTGGVYAGQFNGNVLTQGRSFANQFVQTQRMTTAFHDAAMTNDGARISKSTTGFKNMVFDGAEVWALINFSGTETRVYRIGAADMSLNREASITVTGASSELVQAANPQVRGVYFWNAAGETYFWSRKEGSPRKLTTGGQPLITNATAGIDTGEKVYIGTSNGAGVSYSPTLQDESAAIFTAVTNSVSGAGWGNVIDMAMDQNQQVYILNQQTPTVPQVLQLDPAGNTVVRKYDLPANTTAQQMVFDGYYLWVALQAASGADSVVRIDITKNTVDAPMYLTTDGTSGGTVQCNDPLGIEYDGVFIWLDCYGGSSTTRGFVRLRPTDGRLVMYDGVNYRMAINSAYPLENLMYDGMYMWLAAGNGTFVKYYSGHGTPAYGEPFATSGMNVFSSNGNIYCVRVVDDTVDNTKGNLLVGARGASCQTISTQ